MTGLLLGLLLCVGASWWIADWVRRHAGRLGLVQAPNHRSSHDSPTPAGGGLGIVISATFALCWLAYPFAGDGLALLAVMALALPLAWAGLLDDRRHLSARVRFAIQAATMAGLVYLVGNMPVPNWQDREVMEKLALASLLVLSGVWWVNLFNFMDGIDGIAGGQAVTMLLSGAGLAAWANAGVTVEPAWQALLFVAAATGGFLILNWPPAKIFMGDVGSTWLGFVIFALALLSVQQGWLPLAVWLILAAVFFCDATVTLLTRMVRGERWHQAHRSHAYQRLSRRWAGARKTGHQRVTLLTMAINLGWLLPLAWVSLAWPDRAALWLALAYAPLLAGMVLLGAGRPDHA